jgi:hypothetical protein
MFPFLFEMNKTTRKEFKKCCHPGWFDDKWDPQKNNDPIWYNQWHYFNEAAHNAIYMTDTSETAAVKNLRFDLLSLTDKTPLPDRERELERCKTGCSPIKYVISKGDLTYSLDVNAIRMKLYNTGVGILIFELENTEYEAEEDVIKINDFGRRIYAPYYAIFKDKPECSICAERIYFDIPDSKMKTNAGDLTPETLTKSAEETVLAEPIMRLLSNGQYGVTTKATDECEEKIRIAPVIDDRMFVACYYKNGDFVDAMRQWDGENYSYITHAKKMMPFDNNNNAANRLYTMMYEDGDGICCHSRTMLQDLLSDEHIYTRWLENGWFDRKKCENVFSGTITGFSEYTMISVAKNPPDFLIDHFLTLYVEMAILALAQRASLLSFEYMISECALGRQYKVEDIQDKYILFQSQLLLKEVSPQQQGIEIYDMLEKNLMIEKEQNEIKEQIAGLFEQKKFKHDSNENRILFWLASLGIVEVIDIVVNMFGDASPLWLIKLGLLVPLLIAFVLYEFKPYK